MSGKGIIDSLKDCGCDKILGIRDSIGAALKPVAIITRTWSGSRVGEGDAEDSSTPVTPTPRVVDFSHNIRIQPGGRVQQGDILLKGISKCAFKTQEDIDNCTTEKNVEKLYEVGDRLYQIISVREKHLTWDVQLRQLSSQERFE